MTKESKTSRQGQELWTLLQISDPSPDPVDGVQDVFAVTPACAFLFSHGVWLPFSSETKKGDKNGFLLDIHPHTPETESEEEITKQDNQTKQLSRRCEDSVTEIRMDPHLASRIVCSLRESPEFCSFFNRYLTQYYPVVETNGRQRHNIRIILDWSAKNKFDEHWEQRIWTLCMWNELIREHLAWLSTLGGAFSSLGKIGFRSFAEKAGKISLSQLRLAAYVSDPILSSRSRIFFAISLIQQRKFRNAKNILRKEMFFCRNEKTKQFFSSEKEKLESIIFSVFDYLIFEKSRKMKSFEEENVLKKRCDLLFFDDGTIKAKKSLADTILAMSTVTLPQGC